jgi:hypothetical protein
MNDKIVTIYERSSSGAILQQYEIHLFDAILQMDQRALQLMKEVWLVNTTNPQEFVDSYCGAHQCLFEEQWLPMIEFYKKGLEAGRMLTDLGIRRDQCTNF